VSNERGTALIGTLAIGFAVVLLVGQSLVTIGRLSAAGAAAEETARYAAAWAARHGDASDAESIAHEMMPHAIVEAAAAGGGITVTVVIDVPLVGPEGSRLTRTVTGRATVPISDFRSAP
jgi:hypothetical protein